MRAEIDENGRLSVIPESSLESFALRVWWEDYASEETAAHPKFAVLEARFIRERSGEEGVATC